ncbi:MAG: hypothetical protein OXS32_02855, partial [Verrucomicrobiales bacterium]|nr:hypothetical protein [Verrucomicrobiales bacterium]
MGNERHNDPNDTSALHDTSLHLADTDGEFPVHWKSGSLKNVTDLLFLLQNDPHIQRVENISLSPISGSTNVRVNFQFLSLVIGTKYGKFTGTNTPPVFPTVGSEDRSLYAGITKRALFLP